MALFLVRLLIFLFIVGMALYFLRRALPRSRRASPRVSDPYAVLGLSRGATDADVREAYHRELAKYHPDKVNHLGEDLQKLARAKTAEIMAAYESLTKR